MLPTIAEWPRRHRWPRSAPRRGWSPASTERSATRSTRPRPPSARQERDATCAPRKVARQRSASQSAGRRFPMVSSRTAWRTPASIRLATAASPVISAQAALHAPVSVRRRRRRVRQAPVACRSEIVGTGATAGSATTPGGKPVHALPHRSRRWEPPRRTSASSSSAEAEGRERGKRAVTHPIGNAHALFPIS